MLFHVIQHRRHPREIDARRAIGVEIAVARRYVGEVFAEIVAVQDERDVRGEDAAEEVGEGRFAGGGGAGEGDEVGGGVGHWGLGFGV